jgi:hypothetical protein
MEIVFKSISNRHLFKRLLSNVRSADDRLAVSKTAILNISFFVAQDTFFHYQSIGFDFSSRSGTFVMA